MRAPDWPHRRTSLPRRALGFCTRAPPTYRRRSPASAGSRLPLERSSSASATTPTCPSLASMRSARSQTKGGHMHSRISGAVAGAFLVAMLALGAASASPGEVPSGTIWVTERTVGGLSTVAAIDSRTGEMRGITSVGDNPIGITHPNGTHAAYSSDENANQMSVIDEDTVTVVETIPMGLNSRPHHLMASTNGHYIYVGEY